jgi:anti-sigma factor RsiW
MKISRDVIYDLLPGYFAGEASPDTRALVQEYFDTDPEFRRMAERFQAILDGTRKLDQPDAEAARERATFDRVRAQAKQRQETRAMALGFGLGAVFAALMAFAKPGPFGPGHPGFILAVMFGLISAATFIASFFIERGQGRRNGQAV